MDVRALSGATVAQLTDEVKTLKKDAYKALYLVVGTRELIEMSEMDTLSQFDALISASKDKAETVTISSIPHRIDRDIHMKTDSLNKDLKKLCASKNTLFADADGQLLLRDGSINSAALANDGIHLSKHGLDALIKALRVPTKSQGSVYTPTLYPRKPTTSQTNSTTQQAPTQSTSTRTRYFKGQNDVLSNFYPCSIQHRGLWFHSTEQLIQYRRARITHSVQRAQEIMEAPDAPTVYAIAKLLPQTRAWEELKEQVIEEAVQLKLDNCAEFHQELMATTGRIVEDTPHPYWGRGPDHEGLNRMGLILEALRDGRPTPAQSKYTDLRPQYTQHRPTPCSYCGETNHTSQRCRYDVKLQCESCLSYGHKAKYCVNLN